MRSFLIGMIAIGFFAGCADTTAPTPSASPDDIGPGAKAITAQEAALSFRTICSDTFPNVAKGTSVLKAKGFKQRPATGTFYDQERNLSYSLKKLGGSSACSMVFTTKSDQALVLALFASADPRAQISRTNARSQDGAAYYRALLKGN